MLLPCGWRVAAPQSSPLARRPLRVPPPQPRPLSISTSHRRGCCASICPAAAATAVEEAALAAAEPPSPLPPPGAAAPPPPYRLVTFYALCDVSDPHAVVAAHREWAASRDLRGRIYVSEQGINAQLSGGGTDADDYAGWVKRDERFAGARVSSYACDAHAFPRLALRYKRGLVQLDGGTGHLPVGKPGAGATPLTPQEWHAKLRSSHRSPGAPAPLLLDVRNGYEWDAGRFEGAERPVTESFRETVAANSAPGGPLFGLQDKATPVFMYCTGGIRCDFYSAALRQQGFTNLYSLKGGVQAYLDAFPPQQPQSAADEAMHRDATDAAADESGAPPPPQPHSAAAAPSQSPSLWDGHLFVFDARLAMAPSGASSASSSPPSSAPLLTAAAATGLKCHCCGRLYASAPHRNCPKVDCNRLFLVCAACLQSHGGYCCAQCAAATHDAAAFASAAGGDGGSSASPHSLPHSLPLLISRPLLAPGERYGRLVHYCGLDERVARKGGGRAARKARRRERLRAEQRAWAVDAVAAAMRAESAGADGVACASSAAGVAGAAAAAAVPQQVLPPPRNEGDTSGTVARRKRAFRLAASVLAAPPRLGEGGGAASEREAEFARFRQALRDEAALKLAAAAAEGAAERIREAVTA